jgi:hypothetical protein
MKFGMEFPENRPGGVSLGKIGPEPIVELMDYPDQALEERLISGFKDSVQSLDLPEITVLQEGRNLPKSIGSFSLLPIVASSPAANTLVPAGHSLEIPENVTTNYSPQHNNPFLDTQLGIGLVNKDNLLVAVASAGVEATSIRIPQIQDVSGLTSRRGVRDRKERFKSGLHDGFLWRDTLVNAWEHVADQQNAESVIIVGGRNSTYPIVRKHGYHPGYDGVAERRDYEQMPTGNWIKRLGNISLR